MVSVAEARPPYVSFELRAVEDRTASIEAGHFVAKDVAFALITPQGSKDRIEREAEEWLSQLSEQAREGRLPIEWASGFRARFDAWSKGQDEVVSGTSLKNWPVLSPAQLRMLQDLKFRTVEELSEANEEALRHLGMGGRHLKQQAQEWLTSAAGTGKQSEALAALRQEVSELREQNTKLVGQIQEYVTAAKAAKSMTKPL